MSSLAATNMTLGQKVATFAAQHAVLTREIDELERLSAELPSLESVLEMSKNSIAAAEVRISQGRGKLRKDWRAHSELAASGAQSSGLSSLLKNKDNTLAKAKFEQEHQAYQDALARWTAEEASMIDSKNQEIAAMQKLYECRDSAARYKRLCAHLDRMHDIVFENEKIETAEWKYLDWQVRCALADDEATRGQLEAELKLISLVTGLHSTLSQIDRHYTKIMEVIVQYLADPAYSAAWWQLIVSGKDTKDERYSTIGGSLGFIERRLRPKLDEKLVQLKAHNTSSSTKVLIPALSLLPVRHTDTFAMIEGSSVQIFIPKLIMDEAMTNESFGKAFRTVQHGLRVVRQANGRLRVD
ncbi:hypothetical protein BKA62DRAFT_674808 [Auriculariales sp. MPI-PUGE-AT-0066]|nr:hypothetical protein BKA62DRAFT_674808 [Auriculariales sp. MPI-PUGE-AT-0066]